MKKLITLLFVVLGLNSLFSQELPKNLNIPKKYENYREGTSAPGQTFYMGKKLVHSHSYDIDNDGIADVGELYFVLGFNELGQALITDYPAFYGFDFNNNQEFELEELLYDEAMDGLNGNERWLNIKFQKK